MERWAKAREAWLRERVDLSAGVPSHDTIGRVFAKLSPKAFSACFEAWTRALHKRTEGEIIAIDGKTVRGSLDEATGIPALHLISAFAATNRLVLCQEVVEGHENEISAVPDLLAMLDVEGGIVTGDAMFCQKSIAAQIIAQRGDYVLALKDNHPNLHETVVEYFTYWRARDWKTEADGVPIPYQFAQTLGKGHGRVEIRRCFVAKTAEVAPWLSTLPEAQQWAGLRSIAAVVSHFAAKWAVESERRIRGKTTIHVRYYLTSLSGKSAAWEVLRASREHWGIEKGIEKGIENRLHWCLDVVMREDQHQLRGRRNARSAVRNMALLRKIVLNR
jgi:predicted transposase YbfD/YdcC